VATIHDEVKETIRAHLTLVHVFHAYASSDTPWVAHALSHFTSVRYGRIVPSQWYTMLLSLGIPYVPYASVHSSACSFGPN
jgi:tellurite resistance protein TehA-like permease